MTIRFYWDIFWLLNFIMNLFLLKMTAVMRRKCLAKWRVTWVSLLSSGQMTAVILVWMEYRKRNGSLQESLWEHREMPVVFLILAGILAVEMLQLCFRERKAAELFRDLFSFLQVSVLTGGAILLCREWLERDHIIGMWMVFAGTAGMAGILFLVERCLRQEDKRVNTQDGVIVMEDGRRYPLRVMLDTGNCLVSPYSGERVMIIARELACQLGIMKNQPPLLIPFQSIGGDGLLSAYRIPMLSLQDGSEVHNFLAAVSPKLSEDSAVQLIMYGRK